MESEIIYETHATLSIFKVWQLLNFFGKKVQVTFKELHV